MGYYVSIIDAVFCIPAEQEQAAYEAVCELNNHNELKSGGRLPSRKDVEGPHEDVWFSWMDWNYPETCKDLAEVLAELGFELNEVEGDLYIVYYDNKTGAEDLFLEAIAPYATEGSYISWQGEDGEIWQNVVKDGKLITRQGKVVFYEDDED